LENARKLTLNEYSYNAQLGYISLQQRLTNDEVLAVATSIQLVIKCTVLESLEMMV
jgi:cell surface protein SprA